ncbi:MAG: hypothetical protein ABJN04_11185 [Hyphomicrobiales bacterium]
MQKTNGVIVGVIGLIVPVFLYFFGTFFLKIPPQPTISDYYNTDLWVFFVGSLFIFSMFFIISGFLVKHSDSQPKRKKLAFYSGAVFAAFVAIFETATCIVVDGNKIRDMEVGFGPYVHFGAAIFLLFVLAYISYCLFDESSSRRKLFNVHKIAGLLIVICVLSALYAVQSLNQACAAAGDLNNGIVFWLESFAIMIFSTSLIIHSLKLDKPSVEC